MVTTFPTEKLASLGGFHAKHEKITIVFAGKIRISKLGAVFGQKNDLATSNIDAAVRCAKLHTL